GFAVRLCPFLASPSARWSGGRQGVPGYSAQANTTRIASAATAIWLTRGRGANPFRAGDGMLFGLDEPARLEWYAEGRAATSAEVRDAIALGLPTLRRKAETEGRRAEFEQRLRWLERWIPAG
ncbi:MAG: hypothetical protein WA840_04760, partial [Caulobacteraceae bacterium]